MTARALVAGYLRTPFGRFGGALADLSGPELGAVAVDTLLARLPVPAADIDAFYCGVGMIGSARLTPVRVALLESSLSVTTPSASFDRACCSGMTAIGAAWKDLKLGLADVVVCGGFESLSNTPFLWPRRRGAKPGRVDIDDPLLLRAPFLDAAIAKYSGEEAVAMGVSREEQDAWAFESHERYWAAAEAGYFAGEIATVTRPDGSAVSADESPRHTSRESLARLGTVYDSPTVTAGNAPGLNDGAAMLVLMSERYAAANAVEPVAEIIDYAQVAGPPTSGTGTPADGIHRLLKANDADIENLDLIEINEAFAATPLVSTLKLAGGDRDRASRLRARTNIHGGAVAIGHPLGASGARIAGTLVNGLRDRGGGTGTAAICGGYGQGDALLVKV
jgi:acetyl-CoA C-acetyltransferase